MSKILWLHEKVFSSRKRFVLEKYMRAADVNPAYCYFVTMHYQVSDLWIRKPKTKNKWIVNPHKITDFYRVLNEYIEMTKAEMIVVSDEATLELICKQHSVYSCRGGVYQYKNIPVFVFYFNTDMLHAPQFKYYPWMLLQDLKKLRRWWRGEKRNEPKFDYKVCRDTVSCKEAQDFLHNCLLISTDIETIGNVITCIGFTGLSSSGQMRSFVYPFFDTTRQLQTFWETDREEIFAWKSVKSILENDVIKIMQNGTYDCAYFIKYNIAPNNYILDTAHLFHCIWCESPKKLNVISSLLLDHYRFWKDEKKGDKDEKIPTTKDGMERYWRYNALDCHNTMLDCIRLLGLITKPNLSWALNNYQKQFSNQVGPAFRMSMTGLRVDRERQQTKNTHWLEQAQKARQELKVMTDTPEFNPNSPDQVASLIYDVLGAEPIKMRGKKKLSARSVDEKVLRLIRVQHPLFAYFIDKIWGSKKPLNNSSKYGTMYLLNNRFYYQYGAAGTETGRYNGTHHQFWIGTNPQNIPDKEVRDMFVADPGFIFVEFDYAQSDNWFIAFECEDEKMMENVSDDRDTHCVHAEFFFGVPYERIYREHQLKSDYADHPVNGVRQNSKRIVHGSNFQMAGFTLYVTMGHEAVVATAKTLGYSDAHNWPRSKLVKLCDQLVTKYTTQLYPRLSTWFDESAKECAKNGNLATCAFGRTRLFFGDVVEDKNVQRELSSYYGQGGTAGNINRSLLSIYYRSDILNDCIIETQTHDSIMFQIPVDNLKYIKEILTIMEQPCTIKGRTFTVPVDIKAGFSWGQLGMIGIGADDKDILQRCTEHEKQLVAEYEKQLAAE